MAGNRLSDLATIVDDLDAMGRLIRVSSEVDPHLELAAIAARYEGGPRAVLFEKVNGHSAPVLTGLYWSRELLAELMEREEDTLPQHVSGCIGAWQRQPVVPLMVPHGPIYEGQSMKVDLRRIPVPTHALEDGGPYFDAGVVIARDPDTGVRNASIQRFMVVDDHTLHVNIDAGRHLELYLDKARARGENLAFSVNCGVGPGLHFAAATPAEAAPPETDELGIASAFHEAPLELVLGKKLPVHVVSNAMYALECEIVPRRVGRRGALRGGYRLLRAPGAAPGRPRSGDAHSPGAGVPDHPLRRGGVELGRATRRGERPHHAAAPGAGGPQRVLQPRRMRLLSRGGFHPADPGRLVEAGNPRRLRRLPAAQDGDGGRRRRRHPRRQGRGVGDVHAVRPEGRHPAYRERVRTRAESGLSRLPRHQGRIRCVPTIPPTRPSTIARPTTTWISASTTSTFRRCVPATGTETERPRTLTFAAAAGTWRLLRLPP